MADIESLLKEKRVFKPSPEFAKQAHWNRAKLEALRREAARSPSKFWAQMAEEHVSWFRPWRKVLEWKLPHAKWFVGGTLNASVNCVDRHARGARRNKAAIIWEGEPGDRRTLTYFDLYRQVSQFANVLKSLGVKRGDRVALYLPLIPELAIAMLACARIGAVHSVVFGGFAAHELAPGSTTPSRGSSCRPRAASRSTGSSPTRRCSMPRSPRRGPNPSIASFCSGQCAVPTWWRAATGIGMSSLPLPGLPTACRSWRPTRSTSFTPRARPVSRKVSFATMAAMQ